jgi:hypothetical protein
MTLSRLWKSKRRDSNPPDEQCLRRLQESALAALCALDSSAVYVTEGTAKEPDTLVLVAVGTSAVMELRAYVDQVMTGWDQVADRKLAKR